jgi:hypothetical protein
MNKGRRNELKMLKFKKRLQQVGFKLQDAYKPGNRLFCYKTSGKPCSCWACSPKDRKYNRAIEKRRIAAMLSFTI